jgi:hypothetical protein
MHLVGASRKSMSTLQLARMPERGRRAGCQFIRAERADQCPLSRQTGLAPKRFQDS